MENAFGLIRNSHNVIGIITENVIWYKVENGKLFPEKIRNLRTRIAYNTQSVNVFRNKEHIYKPDQSNIIRVHRII